MIEITIDMAIYISRYRRTHLQEDKVRLMYNSRLTRSQVLIEGTDLVTIL